jgi:lipopolysaccharide transport system ATP-binding protein
MNEVASQGRTVLFVSHQLSLVRSLCERSILVRDGCLAADGATAEIVDQHLQSSLESSGTGERLFPPDPEKAFQLLRVRLLDQDEKITTLYSSEDTIVIELMCSVRRRVPGLYGYMTISRNDGTIVIESDSYDRPPNQIDALTTGDHLVVVKIPPRTLAPGRHLVYLNFTSPSGDHGFQVDSPGMVDSFEVTDPFTRRGNKRQGYTGALLEWQSRVVDSSH